MDLQVHVHFLATSVPSSHVCFGLCTQRSDCREPGYDRVMALARHLVSFRRQDVLSDSQVAETIRLFHNLPDMDKARVKFPPRHRAQLSSDRFARKKRLCCVWHRKCQAVSTTTKSSHANGRYRGIDFTHI